MMHGSSYGGVSWGGTYKSNLEKRNDKQMTEEEAYRILSNGLLNASSEHEWCMAFKMAIKALKRQPCEDAISREDAIRKLRTDTLFVCTGDKMQAISDIEGLPPVIPQPKIGHCKDCKWWRDSDGAYRRGIRAESKCPINTVSVANGFGYCYMFEQLVESGEV